jgi:hypothetical protein
MAIRFPSGERLVAFQIDESGLTSFDKTHSTPVREYTQRRIREFSLSKADERWADSEYWRLRGKQAWTVAQWLIGGWVVLWIFATCVGWVVRGFAGIPLGRDHRPTPKLAQEGAAKPDH